MPTAQPAQEGIHDAEEQTLPPGIPAGSNELARSSACLVVQMARELGSSEGPSALGEAGGSSRLSRISGDAYAGDSRPGVPVA